MDIGPRPEPRGGVQAGNEDPPGPSASESLGMPAPAVAVSFAQVLAGLAREVDAGEHRVRGVLGGASATGKLDAGELILLQANVNRYSEVVDLSARLIDHAVNSLKTVLQGQ